MTIGQLAAAAGVHVETVRYYQRRGLLDTPDKPLGGHRRYTELALERLQIIRNAQRLAFTLGEVAELLALPECDTCRKARSIAHDKLADLGERVDEMNRIRRRLRVLIKGCDANRGGKCPVLLAIMRSDEGAKPPGDAP